MSEGVAGRPEGWREPSRTEESGVHFRKIKQQAWGNVPARWRREPTLGFSERGAWRGNRKDLVEGVPAWSPHLRGGPDLGLQGLFSATNPHSRGGASGPSTQAATFSLNQRGSFCASACTSAKCQCLAPRWDVENSEMARWRDGRNMALNPELGLSELPCVRAWVALL